MNSFAVDRRSFVMGGVLAGIFPLGNLAHGTDLHGIAGGKRVHTLLVDRMLPESVKLGTYARALAEEVYVFDADPTAFWNRELRTQWLSGPRPIAGLTTLAVRMIFEQLGRDHGARIVFSADHHCFAGGMRHELVVCGTQFTCPDLRVGTDWVADMARHIAAAPREAGAKATASAYETGPAAGMSDRPVRLVTWVLAPMSRNSTPLSSAMAST